MSDTRRAAMRLADLLESMASSYGQTFKTHAALVRELAKLVKHDGTLAEKPAQEPPWRCITEGMARATRAAPVAQQEPVAWRYREGPDAPRSRNLGPGPWTYYERPDKPDCAWDGVEFEPLYAAPVAPPLTDEQIDAVFLRFCGSNDNDVPYLRTYGEGFRPIARAILAAAGAKP
jgi:hypothetical protein